MRSSIRVMFYVLTFVAISVSAITADAAWVPNGTTPEGHPAFRDQATRLTWTVTLGRTPSDKRGADARAHARAMGFRLPTFQELQVMYNQNGGGSVLNIRNGLFDYYETSDPNILGNAFGNGFQTPQRRVGVGHNWYIGVK